MIPTAQRIPIPIASAHAALGLIPQSRADPM
jgi:hypothetical protein